MKRSNFRHDHRLLTLINRFVTAFLPRSLSLMPCAARKAKRRGRHPRRWQSLTNVRSD
jgi:hypothetical protein